MRPWKITRIYPSEFDEKQQAEGDFFAFNVFLKRKERDEHFRFFRCWTLGIECQEA